MSRGPLPEFIAPLPLAAVALMAVNDFWLKPTFHNALTGKLSDVAICFFLPLFVSALLTPTRLSLRRRVLAGAAFSALLFTALKTSRAAADVFVGALTHVGPLLGLHHFRAVVDPSDLIALPFIALAVLYAGQPTTTSEEETSCAVCSARS